MSVYGRNRVLPVMTDVTQLLPSFIIMRTVITALTKPFGRPFQVTPKGTCHGGVVFQWNYLLPFVLAALATFFGILINTSAYAELNGTPGFGVNVFWSIYNIAILLLAATVCIELPQLRQDARFLAKELAVIRQEGQADIVCSIADISLGGAKILGPPPAWAKVGEGSVLRLDSGALQVPFRFTRLHQENALGQAFIITFEPDVSQRRALTAKLFSRFKNETVEDIDVSRVFFAISKRILR
jgi:cellulose synthase (UDP-forming)